MRPFRDAPIKQKLRVAIIATTAVGLLLAGLGILIADSILFRGYLQRDLATLARIIADNSTAAVTFDDPAVAGETLTALKARTHLTAACIYREDGTILATYFRPNSVSACPPSRAGFGTGFTGENLLVWRPVMLDDRQIGTLTFLYDLKEIPERMRLYAGVVLAVMAGASLAAFFLSSALRASIATPVSQLALAAQSVSRNRDYSVRAQKVSGDELGILTDAFNQMLAGIESRDIGLQKALADREDALAEAENARELLETTLASIGDAVISTDRHGRVVFANPVARSLIRWPEGEMGGKRLRKLFRVSNELTGEEVEDPVTKVLREGTIVRMADHTVLMAWDGTEIPIDDSAAPIRDKSGKIVGIVLVFRDISARASADRTRSFLASIVEYSEDAIIGLDLNGVFTSWNKGAERMFGYSADEIIGGRTAVISARGQADEMPEVLGRIRNGEGIAQYRTQRSSKSGKIMEVSITASPVYDTLGRIVGASKIVRDITEQVATADRLAQLNADLQRSNEELARSNADLERFSFVASHDLQEPLRMITVFSQLLVESYPAPPDPNATTFLNHIMTGTKRMRELLADLLAYAEIARPETSSACVDLNGVVETVRENLRVAIDETNAVITADPLVTVAGHGAHFISLFQNLIGNAIKYRSAKPPRVHISVQETGNELRFAVADNGMGIEPEYQKKIFVAFTRLHGKSIQGTGIGLAICERVVERYGGHIWVESRLGEGATFVFTLPATRTMSESMPAGSVQ